MGTRSSGSKDLGNSVELATRPVSPALRWVIVAAVAALCGVLAGFAVGLGRPRLKG